MRHRKRTGWCFLLVLPIAYLLYYLEPLKPKTIVHEFMKANDHRDIEAVRRLCRVRLQYGWDGNWFDNSPDTLAKQLAWDRSPLAAQQPTRYELWCGLDPFDPGHRFVQIRNPDGGLVGYYVRLRWNGVGWRIDGFWGHGCLFSDEERAWCYRLIRIG